MTATKIMDVLVPDIGDFDEVPVIEILVSPGDEVALDDPLVTLESDKATMDVPAPFAGVVRELAVGVGDKVSQGTLLVRLEAVSEGGPPNASAAPQTSEAVAGEGVAPNAVAASAADASDADGNRASAAYVEPQPTSGNGTATVYASPSVRRLARERGIDLGQVKGSGRKGRITKQDLERFSGAGPVSAPAAGGATGIAGLELAPWPRVDFEKFGPIERRPRSRIQKISAPNLARNWIMIPHVTHNDEADITELEAFRKQMNEEHSRDGVKLTMVGFLVAASVATLKQFPEFNSSLDGDQLVLKRYYNIGFAADTPDGLVVPVIKEADRKGILEIALELAELSAKAREGKLGLSDMQGGTFTISSLGGIGGTSFTPIVNAPEVAILGVTRAALKPVWDSRRSEFVPRLMVPLSLSYDHRVIDGAAAARFTVHLVKVLSDLRRALL
jgi:pyruvate dehydrogenase E2 component (dihydrolipoyllysine-residue acetyltransferase)